MAGNRLRALLLGMLLIATLLVVAGCSVVLDAGPPQTQTRTVTAVSEVELAASGTLTLSRAVSPSLRVTAGSNVIGHVTSDVKGNRLVLGTDGTVHNTGVVRYELALPDARTVVLSGSGLVTVESPSALQSVVVSGSGNVSVEGLSTTELAADLRGSGRISVAGTATHQRVTIPGSGLYAAGGLTSEVAEVTISGSGAANVHVTRTLTAVVSGSGAVTYSGEAVVSSQITGSGAVVHG